MRPTSLAIEIPQQPDDSACGPTCLHAVYHYYGDEIPLARVIREVEPLETGGTLAVHLAIHALHRGYSATLYTYNLQLFDPSWFAAGVNLADRLARQAQVKDDAKLRLATAAYLEFLKLGGHVRFEELTPDILRRYVKRGRPLLTGLSATYLYGCARETGSVALRADDVGGSPTGHFVVLYGYDPDARRVLVADPLGDTHRFGAHHYEVGLYRLMGAILLGVLSYDANFLVIAPVP